MGCGCKKKAVIPAQPGPPSRPAPSPPQPTTAPQARVILREGTSTRPPLPQPKPLYPPQKEVDRILDKLRMIRENKLV